MKRPNGFRAFASALLVLAVLFICPVSGLAASISGFPQIISGKEAAVNLNPIISGGTPPYHCTLDHGDSLPEGLVLRGDCIISGMHTVRTGTLEEVSPPFTVLVSDSATPPDSTSFTISIMTRAVAPVLIPKVGQCIENTQCNTPVATAWRGTSPYHYQSGSFANGGAPPMGMIVDLNGNLKGKAPSHGGYTFSVCVVDVIGESDCGTASVLVSPATTPTTSPKGAYPDWLSGFLSGFNDIIGGVAGDLARLIPLPDRYPGDSSTEITPSVTSTKAGCSGEYPYYYGGSCHSYPSSTPTPAIPKGGENTGMCVSSVQMGNCQVEFCSEMGPNGQVRGYYQTSRGKFYCSGSAGSADCVAAAQRVAQTCLID